MQPDHSYSICCIDDKRSFGFWDIKSMGRKNVIKFSIGVFQHSN